MPSNPLGNKPKRALYQNTDAPEQELVTEEKQTEVKQETIQIKPEESAIPIRTEQPPIQIALTWQRAGQPSSHDRRSKVPFNDRYSKDNIMVDKRLEPYYLHYLAQCRSKVEGSNAMLLEFLISKGYPIDPHLLDRAFTPEDVPHPPKE
jgi:hypothetical protein